MYFLISLYTIYQPTMYTYIHQSSCTSHPTDVILQYSIYPPPSSPPYTILKNSPYMYFPNLPYCVFHIVRKCTEMHWNNASDGKSSRISSENALRCTEMVDLTGNALKCGTNAREDTRGPFPPFKYDVDFSSTNYRPMFAAKLRAAYGWYFDFILSTNYEP